MITSDIIRQNKDTILEDWIKQVKAEIPEASEHGRIALRNDLPDLLDDIAANTDQWQANQDTHESFRHGYLRSAFENYNVAHVIREYRVLMGVVLEMVDEHGEVSVSDRDKIIFAITLAIEEAAQIFYQDRQQKSKLAQQAAEELTDELQHENNLRDDFVSTVTHDIRNPLANIQSLVSLLRTRAEDAADPKTSKLLDAINVSAIRADELIQNLLDVNLIRIGTKLPISPQLCDPSGSIQASVASFQIDKSVDIRLQIDDSLSAFCDVAALRRALDNLLSNAVKYSDGLITVSTRYGDCGGLYLSVHNEGSPIPADQQRKIFSRYYRPEDQRQTGWGIGLSLVQGIAEAHNGTVSLSSTPEDGTTFTLYFPPEEK